MTPTQLKNSILQLAIQGKLVEQREEEGTAEELFKKIQEEKQKLIEEKKIKKEKPLPEITEDEKPFDIPSNWKWVRLGECFDMYTGNSISKQIKETKYTGLKEGYDYIATKDILFDNKIIYDNGIKIPFNENFKVAYKNSILMCIEGGSAGKKVAFLNKDVCFGNKLCTFNPIILKSKFTYYYLQSYEFKKMFLENISGIIGGVGTNKLKNILIPLPPLEEQKRIVEKLEQILPYIEQYEKAWNELETLNKYFPDKLKKSLLQYAIEGKLVEQREEEGTAQQLFEEIQKEKQKLIEEKKIKKEKPLPEITEDEKPFDIPNNWKWVRLNVCGIWSSGTTPSRTNIKYYKGSIPWLKTGDLNDGIVTEISEYVTNLALEETSLKINPIGSVLIAMYGATIGKVGILGIEATTNQACCTCVPFQNIYNKYLFFLLMSYRNNFIKMSEGGAQPNISKDKIIKTIVPLPPFEEQKRIVEKLEQLIPLCEKLNQQNK